MVRTRSTHPLHHPVQPPSDIPGRSNDPGLTEFLKQMVESMEVLRRQNEELSARFTAAEAQREKESAERREKERRDEVHRGKRTVNPHLEDNESTVQGRSQRRREGEVLRSRQMADRKEESAKKSQLAESLVGKIEMRRGLIDRGTIGGSLGMVSRDIAAKRQR